MSWVAVAVGGAALVTGVYAADQQGDAAAAAAQQQGNAADQGIAERRRQFDALQQLLAPYADTGADALNAQRNLIGLNGPVRERRAISGLAASPTFTALRRQGEESILANASATGGLRGGNVQGALGQFAPALLSSLIQDRYAQLGGLTSIGQNAAAGVGNAGMNTGAGISDLLQQRGAAMAGGALAGGQASAQGASALANAVGLFGGAGGFRGLSGSAAQPGGGNWGWTGMDWAF